MVSYAVDDVKQFMNQLLRSPLFDEWEFREAKLYTLCRYTINGLLNPAYITEEERAEQESAYPKWQAMRKALTGLVRGKRPPSLFQVVLAYPLPLIQDVPLGHVESLLLNIHFEGGLLRLITAASLRNFSLDRTVEQYWDELVPKFCAEHDIAIRPSAP